MNTPVFEENKFKTSSETYNKRRVSPSSSLSVSPLADPYYITMPISSGFGGYTGTTRRKPQPKVKILIYRILKFNHLKISKFLILKKYD